MGIANPARRSPSWSAQAHARGAKKSHEVPALADKNADLEKTIRREAGSATTARLQTMPRLGPITAVAIEAFAPPMMTFKARNPSSSRERSQRARLMLVDHRSGGPLNLLQYDIITPKIGEVLHDLGSILGVEKDSVENVVVQHEAAIAT